MENFVTVVRDMLTDRSREAERLGLRVIEWRLSDDEYRAMRALLRVPRDEHMFLAGKPVTSNGRTSLARYYAGNVEA